VADTIAIGDGGSAKLGAALRPAPDETSLSGWTTPDRTQARTDLSSVAARKLPPLRDSS